MSHTINFHGTELQAIQRDTTVWVSVRRVCDALGLDTSSQQQRLTGSSWACVGMMPMHDTTGRMQDAFCVDLDGLPMWLATLDVSRVSERLREKITLFQREAAKALRQHFFGQPKASMVPVVPTTLVEALRMAANVEEQRLSLVMQLELAEQREVEQQPKVAFFDRVAAMDGCCTMAEVAKALGWGRNKFFEACREAGIIELHSALPTQRHITAGRFRTTAGLHTTNSRGNQPHFSTRVTGRGFVWLAAKFGKLDGLYSFPGETPVAPYDERDEAMAQYEHQQLAQAEQDRIDWETSLVQYL